MVDETLHGILPSQAIEELVARGQIRIARALDADQVQPASLDLRLGTRAFRIRASFLPGPSSTVVDRLQSLALHEIDLTRGAVLETGCVYLVELMEGLALRGGISATANPKSSTGRLDVFTRVILDRAQAFDTIPRITRARCSSRSRRRPSRCWSGPARACRRSASGAAAPS